MTDIEVKRNDLAGKLIAWECGQMDDREMVDLFSELVKTGTVRHLQGMYGRQANDLVKRGILDKSGNINQARVDELLAE